jgi:hypothetical protein
MLFAVLLVRFLLYEIRAATSFEVRALHHLQLLHTVPRWRKIARNIISDNKLRQPCAKPEDILNASIQVLIRMMFVVLMICGHGCSLTCAVITFWKVKGILHKSEWSTHVVNFVSIYKGV